MRHARTAPRARQRTCSRHMHASRTTPQMNQVSISCAFVVVHARIGGRMSAAPPFVQVSMSSAGDVANTFATPWVASAMRSETMLIAKLWGIGWTTARCDDAARGKSPADDDRCPSDPIRAAAGSERASKNAIKEAWKRFSITTGRFYRRWVYCTVCTCPLDMTWTVQDKQLTCTTSLNDKLAILRSHPPYQVSRSSTFTMQPQAGDAKRDGAEAVVSYTRTQSYTSV